jgi:predicted MFS family arabinose efflux permease
VSTARPHHGLPSNIDEEVAKAVNVGVMEWQGDLRLTSKLRIKNKNGQIAAGMAAGAMVAVPLGAALGAAVGTLYEGQVQGTILVKLRYLPIPQMNVPRKQRSKQPTRCELRKVV